jgi:hypothetical protein
MSSKIDRDIVDAMDALTSRLERPETSLDLDSMPEAGRVWSGVRSAFMDLAHKVANGTGRPVDVYAKEGFTLEQVRPERSNR